MTGAALVIPSVAAAGAIASDGDELAAESVDAAASAIVILSFGNTLPMPLRMRSSRGASSGYFTFHWVIILLSTLRSVMENSRMTELSSWA